MLDRIEVDWTTAGLTERRTAMLRYADKLTRTPSAMTAEDVARLRATGYTDRDVIDIAEVTAYYAYVNRIADGLGVQLESWLPDN